jgi:hypothetical protein
MPKQFHNNIVVISSALLMFTKCGDISKAEQLFNRTEKKNLIVVSIMMNGKKMFFLLKVPVIQKLSKQMFRFVYIWLDRADQE